MSAHPSLFDAPSWARYGWPHTREPLARSSDAGPSHDAAAGYLEHAAKQQAQIHAYLVGVGPGGKTAREIADALHAAHPGPQGARWWTIERVDRRMSEMRDAALVSTRNGKLGPGCLPLERREGCAVHVARNYVKEAV